MKKKINKSSNSVLLKFFVHYFPLEWLDSFAFIQVLPEKTRRTSPPIKQVKR